MPRFTIYVPDDLKDEMDRADATELRPNWSAIAQEAFRIECRRLTNRKKGASKMNLTVERLRASKQQQDNQESVAGHAAGRQWAMERAGFGELKRLDELPEGWLAPTDKSAAFSLCEIVWAYAAGEPRPEREESRDFWETIAGKPYPEDAFVLGFVQGAVEIYQEVEGRI